MFTSKHHPAGGASVHCDNARLEEVIARYQTEGDAGSLDEIVRLAQNRALTLIRFNGTTRYCTEAELLSDINFKLVKAVKSFNPAKGSGFTFLSCIIQDTLHTSVTKAADKFDPTKGSAFTFLSSLIQNELDSAVFQGTCGRQPRARLLCALRIRRLRCRARVRHWPKSSP